MKDGIIKNDGTSRLLQGTFPDSYEEFKAMAAAGNLPVDVLFNAEGWRQLPDFLSKETLAKDGTAALFGLDETAVPDDLFQAIYAQLRMIIDGSATIELTVVDSNGLAVKNVSVSGTFGDAGTTLSTDENGKISGYVKADGTTLSVSGYLDLEDYSESLTVDKGAAVTKTITLTRRTEVTVSSSKALYFSGNVTDYDIALVGAGAGGQGGYKANATYGHRGGIGGGGGYVTNEFNQAPKIGVPYLFTVGAGGKAGSGGVEGDGTVRNGGAGGTSSVTVNGEVIHSASGAPVNGSGNGNGGSGYYKAMSTETAATAGSNGTTRLFNETSNILPGGGGGGGEDYGDGTKQKSGGQGFGGAGGGGPNVVAGVAGSAPGGGGGGGSWGSATIRVGGKGGAGRIYLRMRVA